MNIPLKYNFRSLLVRRVSTLMTVGSIALVVSIFIGVMSLAGGLEAVLVSSGDPRNVLVRRRGSDSELSSYFTRDALQFLRFLPGVAMGPDGEPAASPEIVVLLNLPKLGETQGANVIIRGVTPAGLRLRPQLKVVQGRLFQPGLREAVVSRNISRRFEHTQYGETVRFGKAEWKIVGIFEAGHTAFDSEIWVDLNQAAGDFNRDLYSTVLLQTTGTAAAGRLIDRVEEDRRYNLTAQPEMDYFREQTKSAAPIKLLGMFIAVVMGVGACFAAMNTMYAAVAHRTQEIATLRVLGFRPGRILVSFMTESLLLALLGGALGCLLALPLHGISTGTANWQTFSELTFAFRITPRLLGLGMLFALLMGVFGGILPARQASRQSPAAALREA